jgi:L-serine/L-threonine ammonia-lyase
LNLFYKTPLIYSSFYSNMVKRDVYLKLDCLQPSGSFKDRGMAHLCTSILKQHEQQQEQDAKAGSNNNKPRLMSSSGGNAGLAVATVGAKLGMPVDVVVPTTTKQMVIEKLQSLGANVTVVGENWNAADAHVRNLVQDIHAQHGGGPESLAHYISPYDNPLLWTGHSTVIDEIVEDLGTHGFGTIIVSVGGGGLLCGVLEGLQRHYKDHHHHHDDDQSDKNKTAPPPPRVIAAETVGAASFAASITSGTLQRLSSIDSIATSLGALQVTPVALQRAGCGGGGGASSSSNDESSPPYYSGKVRSMTCTDAQAVKACWQLANQHRLLVEPACGAALAILLSPQLLDGGDGRPIVVQVCGGSGVNIPLLEQWKQEFGIE